MGCAYDRILLLWKPKVGVFSRCARVNWVTCRLDIEPRNQHKLKLVGIKKERKKEKQVSNLILAAVSQSSCKFSKKSYNILTQILTQNEIKGKSLAQKITSWEARSDVQTEPVICTIYIASDRRTCICQDFLNRSTTERVSSISSIVNNPSRMKVFLSTFQQETRCCSSDLVGKAPRFIWAEKLQQRNPKSEPEIQENQFKTKSVWVEKNWFN